MDHRKKSEATTTTRVIDVHESSFDQEKKAQQVARQVRRRPQTRQEAESEGSQLEDGFDINKTFKSIAEYKECITTERRFRPDKKCEGSQTERVEGRKLSNGDPLQ